MLIDKKCIICGKDFKVPHWRTNAKYCSKECVGIGLRSKDLIECPACGKMFHRKPFYLKRFKGEQGFFCSKECAKVGMRERMTGEKNHQYGLKGILNASFKGLEIQDKNHNLIDIMIYVPEHPFANKRGRVKKHRLIIEENYNLFDEKFFIKENDKYFLKKEYDVHHIDGNHDNNDIKNLQIVTKSEHTSIHNKQKKINRDIKSGRILSISKLND